MDSIIKLSNINPDEIFTDSEYFKLDESGEYLRKLVDGAKEIVENPNYWNELPKTLQVQIEQEVTTLLNHLEGLKSNKESAEWLTGNLRAYKDVINSQYNFLYPYTVKGIRDYIAALVPNTKEINNILKRLKKADTRAQSIVEQASTASITSSSNALSHYFEELANGDANEKTKIKLEHKRLWRWFGEDYAASAHRWFYGVIISAIILGVTSGIAIKSINSNDYTFEVIIAHALWLAAPAYAVKFSARNYFRNKQLQAVNTHRAVVMKTLLSFIERDGISSETINPLIAEAGKQVFAPGEFITSHTESDAVLEINSPLLKSNR